MVLVEDEVREQRSGKTQAILDALRCTHCNRLLGRIHAAPGTTVEIMCHRCGRLNLIHFAGRNIDDDCPDDDAVID